MFPINPSKNRRPISCLRMLSFRSRIHNTVNKNSEAKLKRIELKLKGDRLASKAILTTVKFMPQITHIPISIMSITENLVFEEARELSVVMQLPYLNASLFSVL